MKTAWILCTLTLHGCFIRTLEGGVYAYPTELECNNAMSFFKETSRHDGKEVKFAQCESVETMLQETEQREHEATEARAIRSVP